MRLFRYFGLPAVRAGDVREEVADGQVLNPDCRWCFLHPFFFPQDVEEEAVRGALPRVLLLRDLGRPMVFSLDRDALETRHHVHVDNV